jgi:outer membrane protein assembly factor BamB
MIFRLARFLPPVCLLLLASSDSWAEDWTRFRGPNGSGISNESGIPAEFGPEKNVVWKTPLPGGLSSPVFSPESIFVTGFEGEKLSTIAMDRKTGRIRWQREIVRPRVGPLRAPNTPASPSPVTDGENVYSFFQEFGLISYGPDGNERWRLPLGPFNNPFGIGSSPVLAGDRIIQVLDGETDSFMLAVDKNSGKPVWRVERPDVARGYSTPALWDPGDGSGQQVIVPGSYELCAYSVKTGEKIWWVSSLTWQLKPTPVIDGNTIYVLGWAGSADFGQQEEIPAFEQTLSQFDKDRDGKLSPAEANGSIDEKTLKAWEELDLDGDGFLGARDWKAYQLKRSVVNSMQAIRLGGKGDMTKTAVQWKYYKSLPNVPSPLLYDGIIYLVKDGGIVTALDAATGELHKQGRLRDAMDRYFSSPVAADGKIFMASEPGVVSVVKPGPDWEVIQANDMGEEIHATPVILDGRIYLRTKSALYCFAESGS